ncbi:MAG TPA: hypothetical protein VIA10_03705 [Gaiellaceae bacterium]
MKRTVSSYFDAFAPAPAWDELVWWPPDVFALTNLVLDHTEGYRFVIAPPTGRRWPALPDWNAQVQTAGLAWREAVDEPRGELPSIVRDRWEVISALRQTPLDLVRAGDAWELTEALLTLHAAADEACAGIGASARHSWFEALAWRRLQEDGTLARISSARVRILPKTHLSPHGISIRSLSRHAALSYESVDVRWRSVGPPSVLRPELGIVLVPWPLAIEAHDFRPVAPAAIANMDADVYGFFEFAPEEPVDGDALRALLVAALAGPECVDAVVFPEGSLAPADLDVVEHVLDEHGVRFLVAGVRGRHDGGFARNYLHFGVRRPSGWEHYEQDKHHRWCLDGRQIEQYHLTRSLSAGKLWWEAMDVRERILHVFDLGLGVTATPLVCEDLARLDEAAELVRRLGPSLVVALLLDGPQLASRWPCRYASILADEPGSSVLTLTAFGMVARSRPPGAAPSRVIAHWNNRVDGLREIGLAPGAAAVLLTASVESSTLWTADGRRHADVPGLRLTGVRQLFPGRTVRPEPALTV